MDGDITFHSDAIFQLEMNLHNVRKELISMLEIYEQTDCLNCYQLKCKCDENDNQLENEKSECSSDGSKNDINREKEENSTAPPATTLPKPNFDTKESPGPSTPEKEIQQDIEAWLDAATKADDEEQVTIVKEASLLSLNDNLLLIDKEKKTPQVAISYVNNGNAVEAFFKYFKMPSNTAVTYVSAKLAAACTKPVKQNYTYF